MKCSRAREYYFSSRDGLLNESERMMLQNHMESCEECASFRTEMEESLNILQELPSEEVSDSFAWNVKRKISKQKVEMIRGEYHFRQGQRWIGKFAAGAAAAFVIMAVGAWFYLSAGAGSDTAGIAGIDNTAGEELSRARSDFREMDFTSTGYPAGFRMVNDDIYGPESSSSDNIRDRYRLNYLIQENRLLKQQVIAYRKQNIKLRSMLLKYRNNR